LPPSPSRGSTPDHLAVIRPPAAARLTARPPASVRSTPLWALVRDELLDAFASRGRELRRFFGSPDLCRSISSDTPLRAPGPDPDERNHSRPPDRRPPLGTSMPGGVLRSRCLPSYGTGPDALSRARRGALSRLAGRHSCYAFSPVCETPARPLIALLSQVDSRPRAPLRLLQVDVTTSTTTDHPNISIRGIRGRDDCHVRPEVAFRPRQPPGFFRVRGRANRGPTFPVAIARAVDFAPTPSAPGTSRRITPSCAGLERRGRKRTLPATDALARSARR